MDDIPTETSKAGPKIVVGIFLIGLASSVWVIFDGCSNYLSARETERREAANRRLVQDETKRESNAARQEIESVANAGNAALKQGVALFDAQQHRAAYEKFKIAADSYAMGTEPDNVKAMSCLLAKRDISRVLAMLERVRMQEQVSRKSEPVVSLKGLFAKNTAGWTRYYDVLEVLALRGSGDIERGKQAAIRAIADQTKVKEWPTPLLMYYAGDLKNSELVEMLEGNPGPGAETNGINAIDMYLRNGLSEETRTRLSKAVRDLKSQKNWKFGKEVLSGICFDLLRQGDRESTD